MRSENDLLKELEARIKARIKYIENRDGKFMPYNDPHPRVYELEVVLCELRKIRRVRRGR